MKTVSIAEFRETLIGTLQRVRRGEVLLIRDGDEIIARIVPVIVGAASDDAATLQSLEQRGIIKAAKTPLDLRLLAERPAVQVNLLTAVLQERDES